jgi:hypothetical protein
MTDLDIVRFEGLRTFLAFKGCRNLLPILANVLRDWPMVRVGATEGLSPPIVVEKINQRYQRRSPWLEQPVAFRDPVDAVCGLIVDLIHAYITEQENPLCLHGAALEVQNGLMIFPNTYRAGKSLLSLKLVSRGARLFSDDVLPIGDNDNVGIALGILPRLRLPLPEAAGKELTEYIKVRVGPQSHRYRYVQLDREALAERGSQAPVTVVISLRRGAGARPLLQPAKKSDVVRDMILRNFARQSPSVAIVDQIHAAVEKAQCFTLDYDNLDEAAELLEERFGFCRVPHHPRVDVDTLSKERFLQSPAIIARRIDDTLFLINPHDESIFYLNALSAGLWHLLADPVSLGEATVTVQQAFPEISTDNITTDVSTLFTQLLEKQLIKVM